MYWNKKLHRYSTNTFTNRAVYDSRALKRGSDRLSYKYAFNCFDLSCSLLPPFLDQPTFLPFSILSSLKWNLHRIFFNKNVTWMNTLLGQRYSNSLMNYTNDPLFPKNGHEVHCWYEKHSLLYSSGLLKERIVLELCIQHH